MQNKCITILLATANRPHFLRNALSSIREQTARHLIAEVIVSENGGNRESADIVKEFPELPIRYIYRDPPTIPMENGRFLFQQTLDEFTAILHDDDWWMPEHLENAISELQQHSHAVAYFCGYFLVPATSAVLECDRNLCIWFGAGYPQFTPIWELSRTQVILASLLATAISFSTAVIKTHVLRQTVDWMNNPFDSDRTLVIELANLGSIIYRPYPEVFIRRHPSQDTWSFSRSAMNQHMAQTTDWIIRNCGEEFEEIVVQFMDMLERCPKEAKYLLFYAVIEPWCGSRILMHSKNKKLMRFLSQQKLFIVKKWIKYFIPPGLVMLKTKIRQLFFRT